MRLTATFPEEEDNEDEDKNLVQLNPVGPREGPISDVARRRRLFGDFTLFVYKPNTPLLSTDRSLRDRRPRWTHYPFGGWVATTRIGKVIVDWSSPTRRLDGRWRRLTRQVREIVGRH